jgi:CheY-like chemotaxis protein
MPRPTTVLVVDDEAGMRTSLRWLLEAEGYDVLAASHGAEALSVARTAAPDIAFVDYKMPGMDGGETCAALHRLRPAMALYLMTAYVSSESAEAALANGVEGILYKPLDIDHLLELVAAQAPNHTDLAPVAAGGGN